MARIVFDPSGTHLSKDRLKVRLNIYAAPTDKAYAQHYVYVPVIPGDATKEQLEDPAWIAALPHIWQLNPHLCVFVRVGTDITKALLQEFVADVFTPGVLTTVDDAIVKKESIHLISPYMRNKVILSSAQVPTFDAKDKEALDSLLAGFQYNVSGPAISDHIEPGSIDVGPGANELGSYFSSITTVIAQENPANATGTLDTYETWVYFSMTGHKMATFVNEGGTTFSTRDYETIGNVSQGSKQTFPGLDCDVQTGDYLGYDFLSGSPMYWTGGNYWYKTSNWIPCTSQSFVSSGWLLSCYATGSEPPGPSTTPSRWIDNSINNDIDNVIDNFVDGGRP